MKEIYRKIKELYGENIEVINDVICFVDDKTFEIEKEYGFDYVVPTQEYKEKYKQYCNIIYTEVKRKLELSISNVTLLSKGASKAVFLLGEAVIESKLQPLYAIVNINQKTYLGLYVEEELHDYFFCRSEIEITFAFDGKFNCEKKLLFNSSVLKDDAKFKKELTEAILKSNIYRYRTFKGEESFLIRGSAFGDAETGASGYLLQLIPGNKTYGYHPGDSFGIKSAPTYFDVWLATDSKEKFYGTTTIERAEELKIKNLEEAIEEARERIKRQGVVYFNNFEELIKEDLKKEVNESLEKFFK